MAVSHLQRKLKNSAFCTSTPERPRGCQKSRIPTHQYIEASQKATVGVKGTSREMWKQTKEGIETPIAPCKTHTWLNASICQITYSLFIFLLYYFICELFRCFVRLHRGGSIVWPFWFPLPVEQCLSWALVSAVLPLAWKFLRPLELASFLTRLSCVFCLLWNLTFYACAHTLFGVTLKENKSFIKDLPVT